MRTDRHFRVALRLLRGETLESVASDYGVSRERIRQMLAKAIRVTDPDMASVYEWRGMHERKKGYRWIDLLRADADMLIPLVKRKMEAL